MNLRQWKVVALAVVVGCASSPRIREEEANTAWGEEAPKGFSEVTEWYGALELEPRALEPVKVTKEEFEREMVATWRNAPRVESPRALAEEVMGAEGVEVNMVAEVWRGRVYSLYVVDEDSPVEMVEEGEVRRKYWEHCERYHPGHGKDCLELLKEGVPYLGAADRRMLMLDLGVHQVFGKSAEALKKHLDVGTLLASVAWLAGGYLALWLAPEPVVTKAVAGGVTVVLVGYMGVKGLHDLVDTYFKMSRRAHEAKTFEELQEAGEEFATVVGDEAMRAFLLAVSKLAVRTVGKVPVPVSRSVQELPGYGAAALRWSAQGGAVALAQAVAEVKWVTVSPTGGLVMAMALRGSRTVTVPGYGSGIVAIRHRGGHIQVILPNGQRWHLPPGKTLKDIPMSDPLGDQLQASAMKWARQWGPHELSREERNAIASALKAGDYKMAWNLERLARGRWVESKVNQEFKHLIWNRQGVDVTGPGGYGYELLSGTYSNFAMHGRRMWDTLFRMIHF